MDHNDLARLLDRTLSEDERGRALAHLADFDDDAEVLGDAAYLLRELEGRDGATVEDDAAAGHTPADDADTGTDPKVVPLRPPSTARTRPRRLPARWLALAAMLAGVLLVPLALSRSGSRAPGDFASLLTSRNTGLPADWADTVRWGGRRGSGDAVVDTALAARLGARQVDLEIAASAGQADAVSRISNDLEAMVGGMPGSGPLAAMYRDIRSRAGEPAKTLVPSVRDARESLVLYVDKDYFSLGAWAEAASLAVRRQDTAFFHAGPSRKTLERAASLPSLDDESRGIVDVIRTASEPDEPDWARLSGQPDALLAKIAS